MNLRPVTPVILLLPTLALAGCLGGGPAGLPEPPQPTLEIGERTNLTVNVSLRHTEVVQVEAEFVPTQFGEAVYGHLEFFLPQTPGVSFAFVQVAWKHPNGTIKPQLSYTLPSSEGARVLLRHDNQDIAGPVRQSLPFDPAYLFVHDFTMLWLPLTPGSPRIMLTAAYWSEDGAEGGWASLSLKGGEERGPRLMDWDDVIRNPNGVGVFTLSSGSFAGAGSTFARVGPSPLVRVEGGKAQFDLVSGGLIYFWGTTKPFTLLPGVLSTMSLKGEGPVAIDHSWGGSHPDTFFDILEARQPGSWRLLVDAEGTCELVVAYVDAAVGRAWSA